jgi:hypothetical protein
VVAGECGRPRAGAGKDQAAAEGGGPVGSHDVRAVQCHRLVNAVVDDQHGGRIQQCLKPSHPYAPRGGDEVQAFADQRVDHAEEAQLFDGAAGVAFLVVDVDDVVARGQFGGRAAEGEPCFAGFGFAGAPCSRRG